MVLTIGKARPRSQAYNTRPHPVHFSSSPLLTSILRSTLYPPKMAFNWFTTFQLLISSFIVSICTTIFNMLQFLLSFTGGVAKNTSLVLLAVLPYPLNNLNHLMRRSPSIFQIPYILYLLLSVMCMVFVWEKIFQSPSSSLISNACPILLDMLKVLLSFTGGVAEDMSLVLLAVRGPSLDNLNDFLFMRHSTLFQIFYILDILFSLHNHKRVSVLFVFVHALLVCYREAIEKVHLVSFGTFKVLLACLCHLKEVIRLTLSHISAILESLVNLVQLAMQAVFSSSFITLCVLILVFVMQSGYTSPVPNSNRERPDTEYCPPGRCASPIQNET